MADLLSPASLLLVLALLAAPASVIAGWLRPAWAAPAGGLFAVAAFACALWAAVDGETDSINVTWAATYDLRLHFELDGLAVLYALLATGIGAVVVLYSSRYMPSHLHHGHRDDRELVPFFAYLLLFMGAMVGLVMAQDLLLIFLFWDLTAIASFFLIGYDRDDESRFASLMAIIVTGGSAVFLLVGAVILWSEYGSWSLPAVIAAAEESGSSTALLVAASLILVGGLAKSAQVPLHFWLPRAMAAPTPVSSYLHSAAMVAAGVFLIGRFYPLIQLEERLLDVLLVIGALSMVVGGVIALTRQHLKQILAYSTISQYGYIVVMFGLGDDAGVMGASFYVIAHGLAKCALFLTAGAVIEATGETQLERMGGLRRDLPLLAYGSLAASATLAALPLTVGFFKDELFFKAALERGQGYAIAAMIGAALTFVYIGRFWLGIFTGEQRAIVHQKPPFAIWAPIVLLAALTILFGIYPRPVTELASAAASVSRGAEVHAETVYHLDTRTENLLALGTYALGVVLLLARPLWTGFALAAAQLGRRVGPARLYNATLTGLNQISGNLRRYEVRDLRSRVASILLPAGLLVLAGVAASDTTDGDFVVGDLATADIPLLLVLLAAAASAITVTLAREHFVMALVLSGVGFSLATVYAFLNASNVALVAVLIETIFSLLFFGVLALLPKWVLRDTVQEDETDRHNVRDALLAIVAGGLAFVVAWGTLSRPASFETVAAEHARLTPSAHATNIVSAILADFRGLDTMGEITVIGIALLGIASLLHRGRLR